MRNIMNYIFRSPEWFADRDMEKASSLGHVMVPVYAAPKSDLALPPPSVMSAAPPVETPAAAGATDSGAASFSNPTKKAV